MKKQKVKNFSRISDQENRDLVDSTNSKSPFHGFIGNELAIKRLSLLAFTALGSDYHICKQSFALLGPASTGKTTLAKMFSKILDLPFIEIHPQSVKSIDDLLDKIENVLKQSKIDDEATLKLVYNKDRATLPPCIIFIDEVHDLSKKIVQGLLKAVEPNDSSLETLDGRIIDTQYATWIIATTDRGLLFDAFDTRFMKIMLQAYSRDQIAKILHFNNPSWSFEVCELASKYSSNIVREANQFAYEMINYSNMHPELSIYEVADEVAELNGIDPFGMSYQRLDVLRYLSVKGCTSRSNLAQAIQVKEEELEKFILPPLKTLTDDELPKITSSSKGYKITDYGIKELEKREISVRV